MIRKLILYLELIKFDRGNENFVYKVLLKKYAR